MKKLTLEQRFKRVEKNLIGVWRFRRFGKKEGWCATYCIKGNYYDTFPSQSLEQTLDKVYRVVIRTKYA